MNKTDLINALATVSNEADISCVIVRNGEVFTYTQEEADGKTMLAVASAVKRKATIHITG